MNLWIVFTTVQRVKSKTNHYCYSLSSAFIPEGNPKQKTGPLGSESPAQQTPPFSHPVPSLLCPQVSRES